MNLKEIKVNTGENLYDLSMSKAVLLVFLRHFGCIFCREALNDLSDQKEILDDRNVEMVFVHMSDNDIAESYFDEFNLSGAKHISDPDCHLYAKFGLVKGNFSQLFGFNTWVRGYEVRKKGIRWTMEKIGDSLQMPGIFLFINGQLKNSFVHKRASDVPDYNAIIDCCV
ncbi:MAG: redoxin domain-containing protein [Saprospiraceae bacterium]|nr:redoxin domain-containing protein [Saprospiraceae bacterium]